MRTIRFTYNLRMDADSNIAVSTEVVVGDDDDVEREGEEAMRAVKAFISGFNNIGDDDL